MIAGLAQLLQRSMPDVMADDTPVYGISSLGISGIPWRVFVRLARSGALRGLSECCEDATSSHAVPCADATLNVWTCSTQVITDMRWNDLYLCFELIKVRARCACWALSQARTGHVRCIGRYAEANFSRTCC